MEYAKLLFLDVDHVLNTEADRHETKYLPINRGKAEKLNRLLTEEPELQIVAISSWRYHVLSGRMTIEGMEEMFCHFGVAAHGRLMGVTGHDPYHWGDEHTKDWSRERWHEEGIVWRGAQIRDFLRDTGPTKFVVLDNLPLDVPNLVRTSEEVGLTNLDVYSARRILNHGEAWEPQRL